MVEKVLTELDAALTSFDEVMTAEYTPDISINPTYGLTDYRIVQTTANGGSIAEDGGTFRLRTGSTANGSATLETAEHGDYASGLMAIGGLLAFRPAAPTGNEQGTWGFYDDNNGFQYGEDSDGFFVRLRSGGADRDPIRQSGFNADRLDGTGPSRLALDLKKPHIFRMRMSLYGQGPAEMYVLMLDALNRARYVVAHRFGPEDSALIIESWGLPIRADVTNGGDTTSFDLHVGGMHFGVQGRREVKPRTASETVFGKSLSGTTIIPVASFRKKSGSEQINTRVEGFTPVSGDNLQLLVILGGSLTGANFGSLTNISDSETALEVDTAATAISGGNAIFEDVMAGGSVFRVNSPGIVQLGQALPNDVPVTLAARLVSGSGGSGTFTFRAGEDW